MYAKVTNYSSETSIPKYKRLGVLHASQARKFSFFVNSPFWRVSSVPLQDKYRNLNHEIFLQFYSLIFQYYMLLSNLKEKKFQPRKFPSLLIPDHLGVYAPLAILKAQHLIDPFRYEPKEPFNNLLHYCSNKEKEKKLDQWTSSNSLFKLIYPSNSNTCSFFWYKTSIHNRHLGWILRSSPRVLDHRYLLKRTTNTMAPNFWRYKQGYKLALFIKTVTYYVSDLSKDD